MRSWLVLSFAAATTVLSATVHAAGVPADYTVQEGDTCAAIALRFYGDARRVDLIHDVNPGWGPAPHVLIPGQVIKLSPKPAKPLPPDPKSPDATLTRTRGNVQVGSGAGKPGDTLARGDKVTTDAASAADIVFRDETRMRIAEKSQVILLAPQNAVKGSPAGDTVLVVGDERTRLGDPGGKKPMIVSTEAARVQMRGEVKVSVDEQHATRVAAYKNTSVVTARNKNMDVRENFGVKTEAGKPPGKPKPLPAAPSFGSPPPAVVFASAAGVAEITGSYGPGSGGGDLPAQFRVEVAHDEDFGDVMSSALVPASATALSAKDLPVGNYFVRVSAIDAEGFEGPATPVRKVTVGDIKITPKGKRRATVEVTPNGMYCGVAGGPLAPIAGAFEIDTVRATSVRCAPTPDGVVMVRDVPAARIGVRVADAKVTQEPGVWDEGEVLIHLVDSDGAPIDGVEVKTVDTSAANVGVFVAAGSPGGYKAPARWPHNAAELAFTVHVGEEDAVAPPASLDRAPDAPPPPDTTPHEKEIRSAIEIHADGGLAFVNTDFQQFGGRGRLGAAYGLRAGPGILSFGVDGAFEGYNREEFAGTDTNGNPAGRVAVGQLHAFSIAVPIQFRYGSYESRFRPYLGVTPEALFENAHYSRLVGSHLASEIDTGSATVLGLTGLLGGEVKVGPGAAFLEIGYRGTTVASRDTASVNLHGFVSGLGYRVVIGL